MLRRLHFIVEQLEGRLLLSATPGLDEVLATPAIDFSAVTRNTPVGLTPAQVRHAYGFDQVFFSGKPGDGSGQTIAIIDAYDDPNVASDLHIFDQTFGLSDPTLTVVKQFIGGAGPRVDAGWAGEISLDVQWAHAVAPAAKIMLVEANSASLTNLIAAVDYARSQVGVSVVSMSWGSSEFRGETSYDSHFVTPAGHTPVTFVASSGDSGAGASWPAVASNVLAVGGTTLSVSGNTYRSETAWSGSGGGMSSFESEPSYQNSVQSSGHRQSPDVAYDGDPRSGFAVYDSVPENGASGWFQIGGTSAGAPQWAAIVAIANQGRALQGKAALSSTEAAIYNLPRADFHDITTGSNGLNATTGYDMVTGLGSPIVNFVVRDLVGTSAAATTSVVSTTSTISFTRVLTGGKNSVAFETDDHGVLARAAAQIENGASAAIAEVQILAVGESMAPTAAANDAARPVPFTADSIQTIRSGLSSGRALGDEAGLVIFEMDAGRLAEAVPTLDGLNGDAASARGAESQQDPSIARARAVSALLQHAADRTFEDGRFAGEQLGDDAGFGMADPTSVDVGRKAAETSGDRDDSPGNVTMLIAMSLVIGGTGTLEQLRSDREQKSASRDLRIAVR